MREQSENSPNRRRLKLRGIGWVKSLARYLAGRNISPNKISVFGLIIAFLAGGAFVLTTNQTGIDRLLWMTGVILIIVRILANTLDGMVAIECGHSTRVGLLYNEAPDRIADAVILIGAGYSDGGSAELGYLAACIALFVSYVRVLAHDSGAPMDFSGSMAKGQRMIIIMVSATYMALAPVAWQVRWGPDQQWSIMAIALIVVVLGGILTATRRLGKAGNYLRSQD